ncbi:cytochrome P450 [Aspergillus unguis]
MDSIRLCLHWAWAVPLISVVLILTYFIYNIFFHPLAKYPGPFLAKLGVLRATYHAWKGDVHLDAWRCHEKYGPIVRCAPDSLSFSSPDAIRDIYSVSSNVTKDPRYSVLGKDKLSLVTLIDRGEHLKRRRLVNRSFSGSNIKIFEPNMRVYVERFLDALSPSKAGTPKGVWGQAIDVSDWCCFLTCDVTTDFLFGLKYDLLRDSQWQHVVHDLEATNTRLYVLMHAHFLYLGRLDKWLFPEAVRGSKGFMSFINQLSKDFSQGQPTEHTTPFSRFHEAKGKDVKALMNPKQIYSEATMLVIAAQDTTSISLRAIFFYLSRHPHAYQKLAQEIRATFSPDESITAEKLRSCTYLNACILESMRMTPGIPGTTLFRHIRQGGQTIAGEAFPAGTKVAAGIYTVHRNEEIFPRPWEFIPERWIVDEHTGVSQEQVDMRLRYWLPFSLGPRACLGKELAQTLICITVAGVMRKFDSRVSIGPEGHKGAGRPFGERGRTSPGEFQVKDHIVGMGEGPVLEFRER